MYGLFEVANYPNNHVPGFWGGSWKTYGKPTHAQGDRPDPHTEKAPAGQPALGGNDSALVCCIDGSVKDGKNNENVTRSMRLETSCSEGDFCKGDRMTAPYGGEDGWRNASQDCGQQPSFLCRSIGDGSRLRLPAWQWAQTQSQGNWGVSP